MDGATQLDVPADTAVRSNTESRAAVGGTWIGFCWIGGPLCTLWLLVDGLSFRLHASVERETPPNQTN